MKLPFIISTYGRDEGDLPGLPVVNMYAEQAPSEDGGVVLQSRRGLEETSQVGAGPINQVFKRDNVLNDAFFTISGGNLYSGNTLVRAVDGSGPFFMAGYQNYLFATGGGRMVGYNGSAASIIAMPDGFDVLKVIVGGGRAIVLRADTGQFYWSDPLDTDIEALDFATAENQPDRLLDCLFVDDVLLLFGAETVEFWPNTQSAELPFQPLEGRVIEKGVRATGCAAAIGSTFAWVTNQNQVCLQDENTVISDAGIEEKLRESQSCRLFSFVLDSDDMLGLQLDDATYQWSRRTRSWSRFETYGESNWIPSCYADGIFGSGQDNRLCRFSQGYSEFGGPLERRFRAGFTINSGAQRIDNISLRINPGQTPALSGDIAEPVIEMRVSRDAGQTWGDWKQKSLGKQGNYRQRPVWRALGVASQPGFLAEFRVTDPVPFRVTGVYVNEGYGGR